MATAASLEKPKDQTVAKGDEKSSESKQIEIEEKKGVPQNEKQKPLDLAILNFAMKYVKFVGAALVIWFMGWMGFSYIWVAIALFLGVLWKMNKEEKSKRLAGFKEATKNEQEAILARMEDLPSWVCSLQIFWRIVQLPIHLHELPIEREHDKCIEYSYQFYM